MERKAFLSPCFLGAAVLLGGCVQTYYPRETSRSQSVLTQDQTAKIENDDRVRRLGRLATLQGVSQPVIEQILLPPGSVPYMSGPVPVIRIVFSEGAFFDSGDDAPRSDAAPAIDVIADDLRADVPDAAVTILGHTDAQGGDDYNVDLSRRRATNVMRSLVARGANPDQLSEVAIGKRQPIAPNSSPDGRARNRRVEFLVSSGIDANLAAVQQRSIPARFLALTTEQPVSSIRVSNSVAVGKFSKGGSAKRSPIEDVLILTLPAPTMVPATPDEVVVTDVDPAAISRKPIQPVAQSKRGALPVRIAPEPSPPVQFVPLEPGPMRRELNDNEF